MREKKIYVKYWWDFSNDKYSINQKQNLSLIKTMNFLFPDNVDYHRKNTFIIDFYRIYLLLKPIRYIYIKKFIW